MSTQASSGDGHDGAAPPADVKRPVEIQIFCGGYHSVAWYFALSDHWKCSRCGAVVSVTW